MADGGLSLRQRQPARDLLRRLSHCKAVKDLFAEFRLAFEFVAAAAPCQLLRAYAGYIRQIHWREFLLLRCNLRLIAG